MKEFISRIWYGEIHPIEKYLRGNKEIIEVEHLLAENMEDLLKTLDSTEKEIFERYASNQDELFWICTEAAFAAGISFTTRLFVEALN